MKNMKKVKMKNRNVKRENNKGKQNEKDRGKIYNQHDNYQRYYQEL